jgi:hypothetical protein
MEVPHRLSRHSICKGAAVFMSYIVGEDRTQGALLPARLEDYVAPDAPVGVIDAFIADLDMAGLGFGPRCRRRRGDFPTTRALC